MGMGIVPYEFLPVIRPRQPRAFPLQRSCFPGKLSNMHRIRIDPQEIHASVFDLDGVLTDTARIHASAWKEVFDQVLSYHRVEGEDGRPFDVEADYLRHVDGRPREDGVRAFLASRDLDLPDGEEGDTSLDTVIGIGRAKNDLVARRLTRDIRPLPGALDLVAKMKAAGMKVAVASSSANCAAVLKAVGLAEIVDARVDGVELQRLGLAGKPDPAMFIEALRRIGVAVERAIVFEDAEAGIVAGRRAGFRLVVGIAGSDAQSAALSQHGADEVVADLSHVTLARVQAPGT